MKNLILIFIAFLFTQFTSLAQAPDTLWMKTFGGSNHDLGHSVHQTTDGGYIIAGVTNSFGAGNSDIWLIKTDAFGDTLWTKTIGGIGYDESYSVQQTTDGGYIITGYTESIGASNSDILQIKTDAFGDTLWTKTFGGSGWDFGSSVMQTTDGGYIITGSMDAYTGYGDICLIKTDAFGDTIWTKLFENWGEGHSVQQTTDGGYIITGVSNLYLDVRLIKTDAFGDTLWTKTYDRGADDSGNSVQQTTDGGYIITGYTNDSHGYPDVWLIKTDSSGDTLWTKIFGGQWSDVGYSVLQTKDGGYIIAGQLSGLFGGMEAVWLIKTNDSGDTLWTMSLEIEVALNGRSVQQSTDGGYIITGFYSPNGFSGPFNVWLIKTTPDIMSYIEQDSDMIPLNFSLRQNYPNPFNPSTKIKYSVPQTSKVVIKVFDVLGNEIETLNNEEKPAGTYEITWYAENLPSGVYFYQLKAGNYVETKKMVLLK